VGGAAYLVYWLINAVDDLFPEALRRSIPGFRLPGLGFVAVTLLALLVGVLARNFVGRRLVSWFDAAAHRIPLFGTTYGLIKQVLEAVFSTGSGSFSRAVLVPWPVAGSWAIGFVTARTVTGKLQEAVGDDLVSVYVPTTPNPTSGFYLLVAREHVRPLDVPVDQAFKLILTMGIADAEPLTTTAKWTRRPTAQR
jgi:uncharacterized membrane protein